MFPAGTGVFVGALRAFARKRPVFLQKGAGKRIMAFLKTFPPHQIVVELFQIPLAEHPEWKNAFPMEGLVIVQKEERSVAPVQTAVSR